MREPYYKQDGVTIHQGDALTVLRQLPDGIVQTCVTSPPYWGLRCYGVEGQLGLEPTPEEFIAKMVELFAEVRRVLRDDGTLWLNLGDSYNSNASNQQGPGVGAPGCKSLGRMNKQVDSLKPKDLCGMPWRVALALQADGWYLRSDIIWHKPNPMPESCTDRPTKSHEYIFLLSKRASYYYDADAVREDGPTYTRKAGGYSGRRPEDGGPGHAIYDENCTFAKRDVTTTGRNKRTVWTVATAPYSGAHFATFPPKLIEPCILAGANDRACADCGKAWRRVVESERVATRPGTETKTSGKSAIEMGNRDPLRHVSVRRFNGHEPDCGCGTINTRPSIVLDPFMGSGTTAEVARKHGCDAIGIELNAEYIDLAAKRLAQGVLEFV